MFRKLWLRLVLCGITIIAFNLACVNSQTPFIEKTTQPISSLTRTAEVAQTQEIKIQPFLSATPSPKSASTLQPTHTVWLQPTESSTQPIPTLNIPSDFVLEMLGKINTDRAKNDLEQLTGELPICIKDECYTILNRKTGSEGLRWAKNYVVSELVEWGYPVNIYDWDREGYSDQNIIAIKQGTSSSDEKIYIVAHLDGVQKGSEQRFPAANDNASGAVDLLEVARVLSSYSLNRTVVLFFSTGEEQGTLGVQSYLSQLSPAELESIQYVVDIDTVGVDANKDGVMELWHGGESQSLDLTKLLSETIQAYPLHLIPDLIVGCG
jgi:hypothetical protein